MFNKRILCNFFHASNHYNTVKSNALLFTACNVIKSSQTDLIATLQRTLKTSYSAFLGVFFMLMFCSSITQITMDWDNSW